MNEVDKLVERVAETMYRQQKLDGDPRWANVGSWRKNLYRNYAKEILSDSGLALHYTDETGDTWIIFLEEALKKEIPC